MNSILKIKRATLVIPFLGLAFLLFICITLFSKNLSLGLSFCINSVLAFSIIIKNTNRNKISIALNSISIFVLLFFVIAPIIQIELYNEGSRMVNNLPFNTNTAFYANIQISLFLLTFLLTYFFVNIKQSSFVKFNYSKNFNNILIIISVLIFFLFARYVYNNMLKIEDNNESIIVSLLLKKSMFMIPIAAFSIYLYHKNKISFVLIFLVLVILFLKNPISERRNAIGPLYLAMGFYYFSSLYKTNFRSFIFIFFIFFFLFPLSGLLTNSYLPITERLGNLETFINDGLGNNYFTNYFNTLHYDAWSNICATIEYVKVDGLSMGYQFFGSIFFFVPRAIWPSKPIGTGHFIANDFLIPQYNLWLSNISCPIISEGYINFGIFGIILFAVILAFMVKIFDKWVSSPDPLYKIFGIYSSFWLFYLMRGDLMSSWAYLCGAYIGIIIIPKTINKILITKWI